MFDKKITLTSTDGTASLFIDADSGGLKELKLISPPYSPKDVTKQEFIDIVKTAIREYLANANPPAPSNSSPAAA